MRRICLAMSTTRRTATVRVMRAARSRIAVTFATNSVVGLAQKLLSLFQNTCNRRIPKREVNFHFFSPSSLPGPNNNLPSAAFSKQGLRIEKSLKKQLLGVFSG